MEKPLYLERMIWQGGMGVYISTPELAREVATQGGIGTVSGTLADQVFVRILQNGDPTGDYRRILKAFPFQNIVEPILKKYFVEGGNPKKFKFANQITLKPKESSIALIILANYCMVALAKEGHKNPIAINYLEKLQMPLIYALTGAMLAGVDIVAMGAGIPKQIPDVIDEICIGGVPSYRVNVEDSEAKTHKMSFDIKKFFKCTIVLNRPAFFPIVSSSTLALDLFRRSNGKVDGFIIENYTAGGHNAPPRGKLELWDDGSPKYSNKDIPDYDAIREIGLPFWIAGGYAGIDSLKFALSVGAKGVSLGSIFALCEESGMRNDLKHEAILKLKEGKVETFTDPYASPTGFPFKIVSIPNTMGDTSLMRKRKPNCNLGGLLRPCIKPNGKFGYRCPAEPLDVFISKGGKAESTIGAICLCNGLFNNIEITEKHLPGVITLGSDTDFLNDILKPGCTSYTASDVIMYIMNKSNFEKYRSLG